MWIVFFFNFYFQQQFKLHMVHTLSWEALPKCDGLDKSTRSWNTDDSRFHSAKNKHKKFKIKLKK